MDAILEATVQVLLKDGLAKLTTTRVAARAGVSVGTLYQYFPNKKALLHSLLKEKLDFVASAVENAAHSVKGATLARMAETLASSFIAAKFRNPDVSVALYTASDDLEGKRLAHASQVRVVQAMAALFATAQGQPISDPQRVATLLFSAVAGVSRYMLESGAKRSAIPQIERDLTLMMRSYLEASACPTHGTADV